MSMWLHLIVQEHSLKSAQMNVYDLLSFFLLFVSEIIDDLAHLVDKTDSRIRNETRRVKLVETKSASCGEPLFITKLQQEWCWLYVL